jgi:hypothetical protein
MEEREMTALIAEQLEHLTNGQMTQHHRNDNSTQGGPHP